MNGVSANACIPANVREMRFSCVDSYDFLVWDPLVIGDGSFLSIVVEPRSKGCDLYYW